MSAETETQNHGRTLREVRVEVMRPRRHTSGPLELVDSLGAQKHAKMSNRSSDFVYVNSAYVGSLQSINEQRGGNYQANLQPPTSVIREQYWACSRWPYGQRVLAIAVGVLIGLVVGLLVTLILKGDDDDLLPIFRKHPAPD